MPNRIIKESICYSCEIDALTPEQEIMFYRIMVNCDDYGRMPAQTTLLRAKLYPHRIDRITDQQIEEWLRGLTAPGTDGKGLIFLYTVYGKRYLQMTKWENHQQIRAKRSKHPAPEDGLISNDINGYQAISKDPVIQSKSSLNQSDSNSIEEIPEKFGDESNEMILAVRLCQGVLKNNPGAKIPANLQKWAGEFDKTMRIDKRPFIEVNAIIEYSQADPFWSAVILNAKKVREKYDQLYLQRQRKKGGSEPAAWENIREWDAESGREPGPIDSPEDRDDNARIR